MDPPGLHACMKLVFMVVYLLASACCSKTDHKCACPHIPWWPHTQNATSGCFDNGGTFRYKCIDGYVRMAGTSTLIRCNQDQWSTPSLQCIVNPLEPPKTTPENTRFPTSTATPSSGHISTMRSESEYPELTSTILPPQHTPEASLETSALPQTSSNTPNTSPLSTSASITSERFHSTSSLSFPTTTHGPKRSDRTTSPSSSSLNSTSSTLETDAVATKGAKRLDRTTPPSSSSFKSTSSTLGTDAVATKGPKRSDRTTSSSSSSS
uniref:Sushi domain-containing protein n=1 Tax=Neogobius melanostomus TaxID=47308 RepID=A0A8C6UHX8_9GOBI